METKTNNRKKTTLIVVVVCIVVVLAVVICWASFSPKALEGVKDITINVEHSDGTVATFDVDTQEEYLYAAVADMGLLEGEDSDYGLFVTVVDGEEADSSIGQYWMYNCNGEMALYGVETQPIADGDIYDFYLYIYE
ncbi:MAG: DUF4430 domain-containing protein [Oscillospiraceae bacterium]|nr:DUF4430 domain-containing protein [Oscillospiraceae bacterium]